MNHKSITRAIDTWLEIQKKTFKTKHEIRSYVEEYIPYSVSGIWLRLVYSGLNNVDFGELAKKYVKKEKHSDFIPSYD